MFIEKIFKSLNIPNDKYICVGVSSGPDSMALLDMLEKYYIDKSIVCIHINHNIRKQSEEEQTYLSNYCKDHKLIFEYFKIEKYQKNNFENEAREKRYAFYEKILKKYNSHTLFLAHHGDDLIETILMKIIRGSNLEGYAGIKTYSNLSNYQIIRPLLPFTKEDLIKYNKENNIKYYLDITNKNKQYTRNRYRQNFLPLLKEEDNNVHLKFLKYSQTLTEYYDYIEDVTKELIKKYYKNNIINIPIFKKEHKFMQKNIIFYILSNIYNNKSNIIKDKNIADIIKLINSNNPNSYINLPKNYVAKKNYNYLTIEKNINDSIPSNYSIILKDNITLSNITIKKVSNYDSDGNDVCRLNSKNIKLPLYLRNKKNGDTISVLGLNGTKKIKEIFIENKISKKDRDTYPLLVDKDDNILWIPFLKKSKYNVKKNEFCDIILTSYKEREDLNEKKQKDK